MPSEGPSSPAAAANELAGGEQWSSETDVFASDNTYATALLLTDTDWLLCTDFGFALPDGANITEVSVAAEAKIDGGSSNLTAQLIKGGSRAGSTDSDALSTVEGTLTLTGPWDVSLAASEANASDFGVALKASGTGGMEVASIDHVTITITYEGITDGHYYVSASSAAAAALAARGGRVGVVSY